MMSYTKVSGPEEELRAAGCKAGGIGIGDSDFLTLAEGRRLKADATEVYLKTETPPAGTYRTSHRVTRPSPLPRWAVGPMPDVHVQQAAKSGQVIALHTRNTKYAPSPA